MAATDTGFVNVARNAAHVAMRINESNMTSQENAYVTVVDWIYGDFNERSLDEDITALAEETGLYV